MTRRYGAGPAHLLAHLAALALAAWAVLRLAGVGGRSSILLWFAGAVVIHDAVLWPLCSRLDRTSGRVLPARMRNHVRLPVLPRGCSCWSSRRSSSPRAARSSHR